MTASEAVFVGTAAVILVSAVMVVSVRSLIHAALWLVVTLFGVAALFAILNAGFLAVVQVVVYIGAIAILFIFAVMLTRKDLRDRGAQLIPAWWLGAAFAGLTFAGLIWMLRDWSARSLLPQAIPPGFDAINALGIALVTPGEFALPFEVASVVLLTALVGAVYVAFTRK